MCMFLSRLLLGVPEFWRLGAFADYNEIAGTVKMIKKEYNTLHLGQHVFQQTQKLIRLQSDTMTAFFCRGNRKTKSKPHHTTQMF